VERGAAVTRARATCLLLLAFLLSAGMAVRAQVFRGDALVLVVSTRSPVTTLDAIDVKRLFIGIPVASADGNLHALLNFSDQQLRALFYQHIVGMTQGMYERRTLALTLEQGRRTPATVVDDAELLARVARDPLAVSFAWRRNVAQRPDLRVVRVLWRE
jgi:hypothetical protein